MDVTTMPSPNARPEVEDDRGAVIVTGALGFIGVHLSRRLIEQGRVVIGVDDGSSPSPSSRLLLGDDRFHHIEADIIDPRSIDRAFSVLAKPPAAVFHLACPASPLNYLRDPIRTLRVSAEGTQNVATYAAAAGSCVIFTSTSEVYGDPLVSPQPETYWGNVNPNGPRSVYDEGKRYAESLLTAHAQSGLRLRIARLFNCYGPGMRPNDDRLIPTLMKALLSYTPMTVYGDGTQTRSLCYVDDMVTGLMDLWHKGDRHPVNLGRADELSVTNICEIAAKELDRELVIEYRPLPVDDPRRRCPDITRARALGWNPTTTLEAGIRKTFTWCRTSPALSA